MELQPVELKWLTGKLQVELDSAASGGISSINPDTAHFTIVNE